MVLSLQSRWWWWGWMRMSRTQGWLSLLWVMLVVNEVSSHVVLEKFNGKVYHMDSDEHLADPIRGVAHKTGAPYVVKHDSLKYTSCSCGSFEYPMHGFSRAKIMMALRFSSDVEESVHVYNPFVTQPHCDSEANFIHCSLEGRWPTCECVMQAEEKSSEIIHTHPYRKHQEHWDKILESLVPVSWQTVEHHNLTVWAEGGTNSPLLWTIYSAYSVCSHFGGEIAHRYVIQRQQLPLFFKRVLSDQVTRRKHHDEL